MNVQTTVYFHACCIKRVCKSASLHGKQWGMTNVYKLTRFSYRRIMDSLPRHLTLALTLMQIKKTLLTLTQIQLFYRFCTNNTRLAARNKRNKWHRLIKTSVSSYVANADSDRYADPARHAGRYSSVLTDLGIRPGVYDACWPVLQWLQFHQSHPCRRSNPAVLKHAGTIISVREWLNLYSALSSRTSSALNSSPTKS